MAGSRPANVITVNGCSSMSAGSSCVDGVQGVGRCCCECVSCACHGRGEPKEQGRSQPISVQNLVVNAYGNVQVNSLSSSGSYLTQQFPASAETAPGPHMALSLELLNQSHAHRSDQQIRQDAHRRILDNFEDHYLHIYAEPERLEGIETEMPEASYPMDFDDTDASVRADRGSSIDELSVYEGFFSPNMSSSGILVGTGGGAGSIAGTNPGNSYLVLTENQRYPAGHGRNGPMC